jgi:phage terminase large subunit-like protein
MKELIADESTISVAVSTYANIANLAPQYADLILRKYEGTRLGRQEIHGEILADVDGALWEYEFFDGEDLRAEEPPYPLDRIVVAVDPAGTNRKKSDETGIIIVGVKDDHYYVLADWSGKYSPKGWADRVMTAYAEFEADAIIVETNYGGDMVRNTLENIDERPRIVEVNSRRGKVIRADPIVALYERGLVHHVKAGLGDLEDQLVSWVPGNDSPDRLDALVHGLTNLARTLEPSTVSDPADLRGYMASLGIAARHPHLQIVRNTA